MQKVAPDATWELKGNELSASYKTRKITILSVAPDGGRNLQAHQEIEPDENGFVLRVRVFSELPSFANETPAKASQHYGNTYVERYNLHSSYEDVSHLPKPELLSTEKGMEGRNEFLDIPQRSYAILTRVKNAGLFDVTPNIYLTMHDSMSRYEVGVALARLLDATPDFKQTQDMRIRALKNLSKKSSSTQLGTLDSELRELQAEFSGELTQLQLRLESGIRNRTAASSQTAISSLALEQTAPQYLVFTLSQSLDAKILQVEPILKIIKANVDEYNQRADNQ